MVVLVFLWVSGWLFYAFECCFGLFQDVFRIVSSCCCCSGSLELFSVVSNFLELILFYILVGLGRPVRERL